jgi:protein-L-isoaspartate(D-aspartate) O-methyltransferase
MTDASALNEAMLAAISPGACLMSEQLGRHEFVPAELRPYAYQVRSLSIGFEKTISNPLIIAVMTDLLQAGPQHTVLEIGTGLGYHAAVLSKLARKVYSMEFVEELAVQALERLRRTDCRNVEVIRGNGANGLPRRAPFDRILVATAPQLIPSALLNQLKPGGRMVIPAGLAGEQMLMLVTKDDSGHCDVRDVLPVGFGPMEATEAVLLST